MPGAEVVDDLVSGAGSTDVSKEGRSWTREDLRNRSMHWTHLQITYHDVHEDETVSDTLPVAYKHIAFQHENEMRAYVSVSDLPGINKGVPV